MDMNRERTAETVELVYRTTTADIAQALRARDAHTPPGRRRRRTFLIFGTLGTALGALLMAAEGSVTGRPLGLVLAGTVLWALTLFGPRLQARAFGGLLEKAGETRAVIDGSGVQVTTAAAETRIGWAAQPAYAETADAFVMLSDDTRAVAMTVLPKRGIQDPADADRLRAILDANLRRL